MTEPQSQAGAAVQAIQTAETALARQNSAAAQLDLQVVSAVLNAHAVHADGTGDLARLQAEIESAVATRTDLDVPAGARSFQRYLLSRVRDIRAVVETAGLDATSKATLTAALAALYASAATEEPSAEPLAELPEEPSAGDLPRDESDVPAPTDLGFGDQSTMSPPAPPSATAQTPVAPPMSMPSWGGAPTSGTGIPSLGVPGDIRGLSDPFPDRPVRVRPGEGTDPTDGDYGHHSDAPDPEVDEARQVVLPDGDTITAPSRELAQVISAAVTGIPIPEAFAQQGIDIPPPGSPVPAPVEATRVSPGDIGILNDRHALAIGHGKALLDSRITLLSDIGGPGFLGWLHPAEPNRPVVAPEREPAEMKISP